MDRLMWIAALGFTLAMPLSSATAAPADAPTASADVVAGVWQRHKATINFFGITTAYSCDALEDRVRNLLLHLGARSDAKVNANCPRGQDVPSHNAWIHTDFYALSPADAASASAADTVKATWAAREVTPHNPYFMGEGDCELVEQMQDLIAKNLSLRNVAYRTECVPHEIVVNGFSITGQALIPVNPPGALKGA